MTYNERKTPADEMWNELFRQADEKGKVKDVTLGDHIFRYALIDLGSVKK